MFAALLFSIVVSAPPPCDDCETDQQNDEYGEIIFSYDDDIYYMITQVN